MSDGPGRDAGTETFAAIDARLTVFALANSLDLAKGVDGRHLQWSKDGLERGIMIESDGGGAFRILVRAWTFGTEDLRAEATLAESVGADGIMPLLSSAIDRANDL